MRLFEQIQALGCRLKIIQVVDAPKKAAARKVMTRVVKLDELAVEVKTPASLQAECCNAFEPERIFAKTGVKAPAHGWSVERLAAEMMGPSFQGLDRPAMQKKVLETLSKHGAKPEEVVGDAVARDRALDAVEDAGRKGLAESKAARSKRLSEIEATVALLKSEIDRLSFESRMEDERFLRWRRDKRAYEKSMADVLSVLVEDARISVSEEA